MGRKPKSMRNKRATSRVSAETSDTNVFTAPTSGLNNVTFTRGTIRDAAKYIDTLNKLAGYLGTQPCSHLIVAAKVMIELVKPESVEPTTSTRMYYLAVAPDTTAPNPRKETVDRFEVVTLKENIKVADDIEWKMA